MGYINGSLVPGFGIVTEYYPFTIVDSQGQRWGLSESEAVSWFLPMAVISTVVGYSIGIAADRVNLKGLYLMMMVAQGFGFISVANLGTPLFRMLAIFCLGMSGGCFSTLSSVTLPRFFGSCLFGRYFWRSDDEYGDC